MCKTLQLNNIPKSIPFKGFLKDMNEEKIHYKLIASSYFSIFFLKFIPRSTDVEANLSSKKEGGGSIGANTV